MLFEQETKRSDITSEKGFICRYLFPRNLMHREQITILLRTRVLRAPLIASWPEGVSEPFLRGRRCSSALVEFILGGRTLAKKPERG